ncbi:hypothetical protein [Hymenobacter sp. YC55]|uniref:hypothetical protein n=1 Tax=Hymenobacter sp. YC55 TaxID=3034019 RepID=UPI0023F9A4A4|nr:hypothetical protein [Hymenobacter sp. YC55]MDF7813551.1 hypothetical protein [Hymenobacter sp. YC55]
MHRRHIFLVLDLLFGEKVVALSVNHPVWIVGSSVNTPVVHQLWQQSKQNRDSNLSLTLMNRVEGVEMEQQFGDFLLTIDEHHGEASFSREEAYTQLTVLGLQLTPVVEEDLVDFEFQLFSLLPNGFSALKKVEPS